VVDQDGLPARRLVTARQAPDKTPFPDLFAALPMASTVDADRGL
jgi:hypothetical protein